MVAGIILYSLGGIFGLIGTVLYIILLVKLFKNGGVGLGILGLFCSPFTYIWGWMKSTELGLKKLMVWLTITLVIAGALFGAGGGMMATSPEMQKAIKDAQEQQRVNNGSY
ncbi:MAG: hypothetical protein ACAH88_13745 [Roseimicrobium sp.]